MNFYELEDSLQPRVFILSSNENALIIQTTTEESKVILNNRILSNHYAITASSNLLFEYGSNLLTQFSYSNERAIQWSDLQYLKQIELQPSSNVIQPSSNAQLYYTDNILTLKFPSPTDTFQVNGNIISSGTLYASNLQITGDSVVLNTVTSNTEQMIITNLGSGPAIKITQEGVNPVAEFYDDTTLALIVADGGTIGIHTSLPLQTLDVRGDQYISGNLGIGTTEPIYKFHVVGDSLIDGNLNLGSYTLIASNLSGTATQVENDLVRGSYLTGNNYNGSLSTTWAVDATSTNTVNKVVVRDASGNFSAGTITATLSGTATQVSSTLTRGSYLTGNDFTGAAATTWAVDATTTATASKIVARDSLGYMYASRIGIGTTSPEGLLDIRGGNAIVSGNIGIGTTLPQQKLDVQGGHAIVSGNVGIGTTNPLYALHNTNTTGLLGGSKIVIQNGQDGGSSKGIYYWLSSDTNWGTYLAQSGVTKSLADNTAVAGAGFNSWAIRNRTGSLATTGFIWENNNEQLLASIRSSDGLSYFAGNTGIGSSSPAYKLDVAGNAYISGPLTVNNTVTATTFSGTATQVSQNLTRGSYLTGNNYNGSVATTWAVDATTTATANKVVVRDDSGYMYSSALGIGTTTTRQSLDIIGSAIVSTNVGIATTNPLADLHIATATPSIKLEGSTSGNVLNINDTSYLRFGADQQYKTHVLVVGDSWSGGANGRMNFRYKNYIAFDTVNGVSGTGVEKIRIDANGNLGIGTTQPNYPLHVIGNVNVSGTVTAPSFSGIATQVSQNLTRGTYLTGNNYNGSVATTWTVDADSANSANKVVVRDVSGNFSAGTITADLSGTATQVSQNLTRGTYLTGNNYNGSVATTWAVDADTAATANKVVARDASAYIYVNGVGIGTTSLRSPIDVTGNVLVTGNIGIGTTIAKYPIHVHSAEDVFTVNNGKVAISYGATVAASTDLEIHNSSDTSYTGILLTNNGNNYPTASLRIEGKRYDQSSAIAYAGSMGLYRYNNNAALDSELPLGLIHFGGNHTSGSTANKAFSAYIGAISEENFVSSSNMRTALVFALSSNGYDYFDTSLTHTNEKMRINSYGNLGIGTNSPLTTLDIRGNSYLGKGLNGEYNSFQGGPFHKQSGWDAEGTSHTISYPDYCVANNSSGTLHIQVKSATADKLGNASISFLKANATNVDLFNIHYHKTNNLTTFTITASTNDITVTTDSDCAVAWSSIGSC